MNMKNNIKKKSSARRAAMQALYTWDLSKTDLNIIKSHYLEERNPNNLDVDYFNMLLNEIPIYQDQLIQEISKYSDRPINKLDPIEMSILKVASYELMFQKNLPFKVIISEALELANMFGSDTSYKFINSVIDRLAKNYRKI